MNLEDEVNKRISTYVSRTDEDQRDIARRITNGLDFKKNIDASIAKFHQDVPFAHDVITKANTIILPPLEDFLDSLKEKFPIVKLEGGVSHELHVKKIIFHEDGSYYVDHYFSFGSLRYILGWGKIYPEERFTRKPLFGQKEDWVKHDSASVKVEMITTPTENDREFGYIYGWLSGDYEPGNGIKILNTSYDGARIKMPIEQWLKNPQDLRDALIKGLRKAKYEAYIGIIGHDPPSGSIGDGSH